MARIQRWMALLATDETAPAWNPTARRSTPASLRRAAWWLVDNGHAPDLQHEMVCILLALYIVDYPGGVHDGLVSVFRPRDAA